MAISSNRTSGQVHVPLAENHRSIQFRPSDNFRIASGTICPHDFRGVLLTRQRLATRLDAHRWQTDYRHLDLYLLCPRHS